MAKYHNEVQREVMSSPEMVRYIAGDIEDRCQSIDAIGKDAIIIRQQHTGALWCPCSLHFGSLQLIGYASSQ